ncbi:MAG: hypothetical protein OXM60_24005 [Defluviicoccus sp.]|nr:hypothetical protein [Defluviicoccus sp.]
MSRGWMAPQRRSGEKKSAARKRWKSTGRCQMCGRRLRHRGRVCGACVARSKKRHAAPEYGG